jgi:hypothetical protein
MIKRTMTRKNLLLVIVLLAILPVNVFSQKTKTLKPFIVNISWNNDNYPDAPMFTPRKKITVLDVDGPGMLTNLHFSAYLPAAGGSMNSGVALWLTVFYDNEDKPAIDMPLMDFLGDVDCQAVYYTTVYFSKVKQSHNFYLKMPFKKHIKVEIENRSDVELVGYGAIQVQPVSRRSLNDLHELRVDYRVGRETIPENIIELLNVNCGGEIVAHWLQLDSDEKLCKNGEYMCEGNAEFYLDGEEIPSVEYLGTEDLYGYSWGFQGIQSDGKSAIFRVENKKDGGAIIGMLRCREIDRIPFDKSCKLLLNYRNECFSSYAKPKKPSPCAELPKTNFEVNYKSCVYYYAK